MPNIIFSTQKTNRTFVREESKQKKKIAGENLNLLIRVNEDKESI